MNPSSYTRQLSAVDGRSFSYSKIKFKTKR